MYDCHININCIYLFLVRHREAKSQTILNFYKLYKIRNNFTTM